MKLGAEPKKIAILGVLAAVLAYFVYTNLLSGGAGSPAASTPAPARSTANATRQAAADAVVTPAPEVRPRPPLRPGAQPQLKLTFNKKGVDPTTVDPTLRLDLLAKMQAVKLEGGERNLFQFGAAPMPKVPEPKIAPKPIEQPKPADYKPPEPPKPPPPPIPLKFFGYSSVRAGAKKAFFLDGEDIIVAIEGQTIKNRYKVVRIGINSVVMEDTQDQHQQTLPLVPEQTTG